eukprot:gene2458-3168_t
MDSIQIPEDDFFFILTELIKAIKKDDLIKEKKHVSKTYQNAIVAKDISQALNNLEKNKKYLEFLTQEQINNYFGVLLEIGCIESCSTSQKKFEPNDVLYKFCADELKQEFVGKMTKRYEDYRKIRKMLQNSKNFFQLFDKFHPEISVGEKYFKQKKIQNSFLGCDFVKYIMKHYGYSEFSAVYLGNELLKMGIYKSYVEGEVFQNSDYVYIMTSIMEIPAIVEEHFRPKTRKKSASFATKRRSLFNIDLNSFQRKSQSQKRLSVDLPKPSSTSKDTPKKNEKKGGLWDVFVSLKNSMFSPKKSTKVYCVKISELPEAFPTVFSKLTEFIEKWYLKTNGIFRVSGRASEIRTMKEKIDKGCVFDDLIKDYADHENMSEVEILGHSLAGVFKLWFREMADPIVPFEKCDAFLKIWDLKPDEKIIALTNFVQNELPNDNRIILEKLLTFLTKVAAESSVNKMSTNNLSIVFASNIIRPLDSDPITLASKTPLINGLFRILLENVDSVFPFDFKDAISVTSEKEILRISNVEEGVPKEELSTRDAPQIPELSERKAPSPVVKKESIETIEVNE